MALGRLVTVREPVARQQHAPRPFTARERGQQVECGQTSPFADAKPSAQADAECRQRLWDLEDRYARHVKGEEQHLTSLESLRRRLKDVEAINVANVASAEEEIAQLQKQLTDSQWACKLLESRSREQDTESDALQRRLHTLKGECASIMDSASQAQVGARTGVIDLSVARESLGRLRQDADNRQREVELMRVEVTAAQASLVTMHRQALLFRRQVRQSEREPGLPATAPVKRHERDLLACVFQAFAGLRSPAFRERCLIAGVMHTRSKAKQVRRSLEMILSGWSSEAVRLTRLRHWLQRRSMPLLNYAVKAWHAQAQFDRWSSRNASISRTWAARPLRRIFLQWVGVVRNKYLEGSRRFLHAWRQFADERRRAVAVVEEIFAVRQESNCSTALQRGLRSWCLHVVQRRAASSWVRKRATRHSSAVLQATFQKWLWSIELSAADQVITAAAFQGWRRRFEQRRQCVDAFSLENRTALRASFRCWSRWAADGQRRRKHSVQLLSGRQCLSLCLGAIRQWQFHYVGFLRQRQDMLRRSLSDAMSGGRLACENLYAIDAAVGKSACHEDSNWYQMLDELQLQVSVTAQCTTELNEALSSGRALESAIDEQRKANQAYRLELEELSSASRHDLEEVATRSEGLERELLAALRQQAGMRASLRYYSELSQREGNSAAKADLECTKVEVLLEDSGRMCAELLSDRGQTLADLEVAAEKSREEVVRLEQVLEERRAMAVAQQGALRQRAQQVHSPSATPSGPLPAHAPPPREVLSAQVYNIATPELVQMPSVCSGGGCVEGAATGEELGACELTPVTADDPGPLQRYPQAAHSPETVEVSCHRATCAPGFRAVLRAAAVDPVVRAQSGDHPPAPTGAPLSLHPEASSSSCI
mmetsp:Transcript_19920/g.46351  ORF Transcript_19920/g.46351 Transcript_19920/m.46351 type:complete len:884 (-) Transcript_19920:153-2804(-)